MKKTALCQLLLFPLIILFFTACSGPGNRGYRTFYISPGGNDANSGTSEQQAWKSVGPLNEADLSPGDRVLFQGGGVFSGTIRLTAEDSGTEQERVTISSYGEGVATLYGMAAEGLVADSCHFLTVQKLRFTGSGRLNGNVTDGVLARQCDGIELDQLDVSGFQHSGVHLHRCNDARITRVYAHENGFSGIHVTGTTMRDAEQYDNHNLYIGYCVAENNPGDPTVTENHSGNGILASSVRGGTIEYCEAFNNGWDMIWTGNGPVGIWIWDCTGFTIQHCIAHHNRTNPVAADGGGFDFDGGVSNSVIQYCIAHHNEGAGFGLYEFGAAKPWENNVVRYNLSYNDGSLNGGSVGIWKNDDRGVMRNCQIYNNTFYNGLDSGSNLWIYDHYPGFEFRNNVFVYDGRMVAEDQVITEELFQGNLYWNLSGDPSFLGYGSLHEWALAEWKEMIGETFAGVYGNPGFRSPESLDLSDPERIGPETLGMFTPAEDSPLIDRGLSLMELLGIDPGTRDLAGTGIPHNGLYDIGAIEAHK